jgi:hypothetical protein
VSSHPPARDQRPESAHSVEGDALLEEVRAALATLEGLLAHGEHLGEAVVGRIRSTVSEVQERLDRRELFVVVVGEPGAGKTTFLNALLGDEVLPSRAKDPLHAAYLRASAAEGYVARRADGTEVVFEKRHPDPTLSLHERVRALEVERIRTSSERASAAVELDERRQQADQAQGELKGAFQSFEAARAEAERLAEEIAHVETEKEQLVERADSLEKELPKLLVNRPALWAVWFLIAYLVMLLVYRRGFRAWRDTLEELEAQRSKSSRLKLLASEAALVCRQAEAALDPIASPAQSTQEGWVSAKKGLGDIDSRLRHIGGQVAALRAEIEEKRKQRRQLFQNEVHELLAADRRTPDLLELDLAYPARHLPEDVTIIDAAGVASANAKEEQRAWEIIRERADGCILVSELERAVTGSTKGFLQRVRDVVPHVLLVLTKIDESFVAAKRQGNTDPWEYVEHARRIATRRFADEIGRDPSGVLSIAVAAEPALEDSDSSGLVRRFAAEVAKLFQLLRHERALILGTRAAGAVQRCIESAAEEQQRAERYYERRILGLEETKRPEPEQFRAEQVAAAQKAILEAAAEVTSSARKTLESALREIESAAARRIEACKDTKELHALVPGLEKELEQGVRNAAVRVNREIGLHADAGVKKIELGVFEALRLRYEIAHLVTRGSNPSIHLEEVVSAPPARIELGPSFEATAKSFVLFRVGLGVGGAAGGGLLGSLAGSPLGAVIGAAAGAFLAFARTRGSLRRHALRAVSEALRGQEQALVWQLDASEPSIAEAVSTALDDSVARAIGRFDQWIAEPLEAERNAIQREKTRLEDLQTLRERLFWHNEQLEVLTEAAVAASLGLCR